jgi:hypothetical protein
MIPVNRVYKYMSKQSEAHVVSLAEHIYSIVIVQPEPYRSERILKNVSSQELSYDTNTKGEIRQYWLNPDI